MEQFRETERQEGWLILSKVPAPASEMETRLKWAATKATEHRMEQFREKERQEGWLILSKAQAPASVMEKRLKWAATESYRNTGWNRLERKKDRRDG
jgi:hypothetical protein